MYLPGKRNIADPLSRLLKVDNARQSENREAAEEYVSLVAVNVTTKALTTREVEEASGDDAELQLLHKCIDTGAWVGCPNKIYADISGELCVIAQLVLTGSRIVIPHTLRPQALAHEGHLGIVALRGKVWWPDTDYNVEKYCRVCHGCQLVVQPDPPETIRSTTLLDGQWKDVTDDSLDHYLLDIRYWSW